MRNLTKALQHVKHINLKTDFIYRVNWNQISRWRRFEGINLPVTWTIDYNSKDLISNSHQKLALPEQIKGNVRIVMYYYGILQIIHFDDIIQSNLVNPTFQWKAEQHWITKIVRLPSYLHNLTMANISDNTVKATGYISFSLLILITLLYATKVK